MCLLRVSHHELIHVRDVIPATAAATSATNAREKLEVRQPLLVKSVVVSFIVIILVVLVAAKVANVVVVCRGAILKAEGVVCRPGYDVVAAAEATSAKAHCLAGFGTGPDGGGGEAVAPTTTREAVKSFMLLLFVCFWVGVDRLCRWIQHWH